MSAAVDRPSAAAATRRANTTNKVANALVFVGGDPLSLAEVRLSSGLAHRTIVREIDGLVAAGLVAIDSGGQASKYRWIGPLELRLSHGRRLRWDTTHQGTRTG